MDERDEKDPPGPRRKRRFDGTDREPGVSCGDLSDNPTNDALDERDDETDEASGIWARTRIDALKSERRKRQLGASAEGEVGETTYEGVAQEFDPLPDQAGDVPLEPFNTRAEEADGHFDADGHFVWREASEEAGDSWLKSVEKAESEFFETEVERQAAAEKALRFDSVFGSRRFEDVEGEDEENTMRSAIVELLSHLQEQETPTDALRRLKPKKCPSASARGFARQHRVIGKTTSNKKRLDEFGPGASAASAQQRRMDGDVPMRPEGRTEAAAAEDPVFNRIAEICDLLLTNGTMIYTETREAIAEMAGGSAFQRYKRWEFRWAKEAGGQVYGKYPSSQLIVWRREGYFDGPRTAEFRLVSTIRDGVWTSFADLDWDAVAADAEREEMQPEEDEEEQEATGVDSDDEEDLNRQVLERVTLR